VTPGLRWRLSSVAPSGALERIYFTLDLGQACVDVDAMPSSRSLGLLTRDGASHLHHGSDDRAHAEKDSAGFKLVCCSCLEMGSGRCSGTPLANVSSDLRSPLSRSTARQGRAFHGWCPLTKPGAIDSQLALQTTATTTRACQKKSAGTRGLISRVPA